MKSESPDSMVINPEEQINKLRSLGIPDEEAREFVSALQESFFKRYILKNVQLIALILAVISLGLVIYSLYLLNKQSNRIDLLGQDMSALNTQIVILSNNEKSDKNDKIPSPTLSPTSTQTPTATLIPTQTLTPQPTFVALMGKIMAPEGVNVRSDPDRNSTAVGQLANNSIVQILARDDDKTWVKVFDTKTGVLGWVINSRVYIAGIDIADIPLNPMPTITPMPTDTATPAISPAP